MLGAYQCSDNKLIIGTSISASCVIWSCYARLGHLSIEKLVLACSRAVLSRLKQNVGMLLDNRPPTVMHSQVDSQHNYNKDKHD